MKKQIIFFLLLITNQIIFAQEWDIIIEQDTNLNVYMDILADSNKSLDFWTASRSIENTEKGPGEVYLLNGDTLKGIIKISGFGGISGNNFAMQITPASNPVSYAPPSKIIVNPTDSSDKELKFRADKVIGFKKGDKHYVTKETYNMPPFYIEMIQSGFIKLYIFIYHSSTSTGYSNITLPEVVFYVDGFHDEIKKIRCEDVNYILNDYYDDYPVFRNQMKAEIKSYTKGLFKNKGDIPCSYLLRLIQLRNLLDDYKTTTANKM